jgi:hypothetical protein
MGREMSHRCAVIKVARRRNYHACVDGGAELGPPTEMQRSSQNRKPFTNVDLDIVSSEI